MLRYAEALGRVRCPPRGGLGRAVGRAHLPGGAPRRWSGACGSGWPRWARRAAASRGWSRCVRAQPEGRGCSCSGESVRARVCRLLEISLALCYFLPSFSFPSLSAWWLPAGAGLCRVRALSPTVSPGGSAASASGTDPTTEKPPVYATRRVPGTGLDPSLCLSCCCTHYALCRDCWHSASLVLRSR